jgi:hypothetical protein
LQAKDTVTRFGSESVARGKLDVLPCKHSNHFKPNTTLDPQLILKILLERFLHKNSLTKRYRLWCIKLRGRDFKIEASQNPLWLQIPNSKLHSLFENATPSAIWGGLAGQRHSDTVWF